MINFINKNAGIIVLVALVIAIIYVFVPKVAFGTAAPTGTVSRFGAVGSQYGYYLGVYGNETQAIDDLGNVVLGTQGTLNTQSLGGQEVGYYQQTMAATSSVLCGVQNPFAATTTVLNLNAQVTANGIATAELIDVSTSSTAIGSSTPSFVRSYSAGTGLFQFFWTPGFASTSNQNVIGYDEFSNTGTSPYVLAPSEYLTWRIATATPTTLASYYTGTCSATFLKP